MSEGGRIKHTHRIVIPDVRMWMEIRRGKMRNYLSDKKASEEKTEEKLSAARHLIKPSPSCHAHKVDLWRAFQVPHLVRAPVLALRHPFHAVHSQEPRSCYQTLPVCLVPLVTAQSSPGATVTNQDCAWGRQFPLTPVLQQPTFNANEI